MPSTCNNVSHILLRYHFRIIRIYIPMMRRFVPTISIWLWVLSLPSFSQESASTARNNPSGRPVEIINGDYTYDLVNEILEVHPSGDKQPTLILGERSITADVIKYQSQKQILSATGDVHLWSYGVILRGERLHYFVDKEEGELKEVKQSQLSEGVYFYGKTLKFRQRPAKTPKGATAPVTEPEYTLLDGALTTNDMPVPYYEIEPNRTVIFPERRYWAYNLLFKAQNWPLFYLPLFTGSLREHQIAHFFNIGYYSDLGVGIYNRLMIKATEEVTIDLYGDYFTKVGIGKGLKTRFDVPGEYGPKGYVYGYHIEQEGPDNDYVFDGDDRYLLAGEYEQNLPYEMRFTARGHRFSDSEYRWDYRSPESNHEMDLDLLERDIVSFMNLSKWWDDQSLRITTAANLDPFYYSSFPFVERKPQVHFEQYPTRLFETDLFADLHLDYGRYRRERGVTYFLDDYNIEDLTYFVDEVDRFDGELTFTYPFYLPGRITVTPWIGFRGTHYADPVRSVYIPRTPFEFDSETRSMLEGGTEISTRFVSEFDPFLDRYDKMRAVIEPILNYGYYNPSTDLEELTRDAGRVRFPYLDPTDEIRYEMHNLSAVIRTTIQGKDSSGRTSDFMQLSVGGAYDQMPDENLRFSNFEFFDDPARYNDQRYKDLLEKFTIHPFDWISLGNTLRYDVEDGDIRSSYYYANLQPIQRLQMSLGFYTFLFPNFNPNVTGDEQKDAVLQLLYDVSPKWQLFYSSRFDVDEGISRTNRIGIMRDLYDFFCIFRIGHRNHPTVGDDFTFDFTIGFWGIDGRQGQNQTEWTWR